MGGQGFTPGVSGSELPGGPGPVTDQALWCRAKEPGASGPALPFLKEREQARVGTLSAQVTQQAITNAKAPPFTPAPTPVNHTPPPLAAPTASGIPHPPQGKEMRAAALRAGEEGVALPVMACLSPPHLSLWLRAAAAAKSLQSCPTLCDPRDGSPPGSPVSGILQARTLEWVAISFSNA